MSVKKQNAYAPKRSKVKLKLRDIKPRTLVDPETGEVVEMVQQIREGFQDTNWHKVWLMDLIGIIAELGSKRMQVFEYLVEQLQANNMMVATYSKIQEATNCSKPTVSKVINLLLERDVIKKIQQGVYMLNPDLVAKGSSTKRQNLLISYRGISPDEESLTEDTLSDAQA